MPFRGDTPDPRQRRNFSSWRAATERTDRGEMLMASQTESHHAFHQRQQPPTLKPRSPRRPQAAIRAAIQAEAHLGDPHPPATRGPHARPRPVQHRRRQQATWLRSRPSARGRRPPRRRRPPADQHRPAENRYRSSFAPVFPGRRSEDLSWWRTPLTAGGRTPSWSRYGAPKAETASRTNGVESHLLGCAPNPCLRNARLEYAIFLATHCAVSLCNSSNRTSRSALAAYIFLFMSFCL